MVLNVDHLPNVVTTGRTNAPLALVPTCPMRLTYARNYACLMCPLAFFEIDPFACSESDILSNALKALAVVLTLSTSNAAIVSYATA